MSEIPISLRPVQDRELLVEVAARSAGKMRKEAMVTLVQPPGTSFTIACDEGSYLGGDDTAPPPLAFFSASLAF